MSFLLSLCGSFLGAFFVVFWKVYVETNNQIILAYEDTCYSLRHAHDAIFRDCYNGPDDDFDPPSKSTVSCGLSSYFEKKFFRYTGFYSQQIQMKIDDLKAVYYSIDDPEFLTRYGKDDTCADYNMVDVTLREILELCEEEMRLRRKNLFAFWRFRLKNQFSTFC